MKTEYTQQSTRKNKT